MGIELLEQILGNMTRFKECGRQLSHGLNPVSCPIGPAVEMRGVPFARNILQAERIQPGGNLPADKVIDAGFDRPL